MLKITSIAAILVIMIILAGICGKRKSDAHSWLNGVSHVPFFLMRFDNILSSQQAEQSLSCRVGGIPHRRGL
jgi:hypothetical protein